MSDALIHIGNALVQHGPDNDRVYLMKLGSEPIERILAALEALALENRYGKIFAKVPATALASFEQHGFVLEASIPRYYGGQTCCFASRFLDPIRQVDRNASAVARVLDACLRKPLLPSPPVLPAGFTCRETVPEDADAMAQLYAAVFASYPFPIHDPDYLRGNMRRGDVRYFAVHHDQALVGLSSAELDREARAAEMTDFAVAPECRGRKLALHLLGVMERALAAPTCATAFTIARAVSHGMNDAFARLGYRFGGTLVNNTQISGAIESMNVWHKPL
ncbi:MAG TPA: putative beta-lysine N-acetyltransferase [Verrucomicrobia bacterium]|nr:MAG: putative beta-lysine N-acetyltransferase [Lentisphaerae bacterium GWF2_57_35]HBA85918.1 putative beta-lysine N-acetyltransferase [Verrucomicrobiota bacterium]